MKRHAMAALLAISTLFGCISVPREPAREHPLDPDSLGPGQVQSDRDGAVHMLAALAGQGADAYKAVERPRWRMETVLQLPTALPTDLLGRRPDVLAARSRVEIVSAGRDVVKADFYPDVNLSAFAGTASIGLANLFLGRDSGVYGVGPAIHLPLFDAGRLKAQYRGATAEIDTAVAGYNETVLRAVREVSDQITRIDALADQLEQQHKSLDSAEAAYSLASERYQAGLSDHLTVLNAETHRFGSQQFSPHHSGEFCHLAHYDLLGSPRSAPPVAPGRIADCL